MQATKGWGIAVIAFAVLIGEGFSGFASRGLAQTDAPGEAESRGRGVSLPAPTEELLTQLEGIYKDLHANPELAMQEQRTAGIAAEWLRRHGYEVTENVGGTGVVGLLRNGAGATVLLRADMDALPMQEATGGCCMPAARSSRTPPVSSPRWRIPAVTICTSPG